MTFSYYMDSGTTRNVTSKADSLLLAFRPYWLANIFSELTSDWRKKTFQVCSWPTLAHHSKAWFSRIPFTTSARACPSVNHLNCCVSVCFGCYGMFPITSNMLVSLYQSLLIKMKSSSFPPLSANLFLYFGPMQNQDMYTCWPHTLLVQPGEDNLF